MQDSKLLFLLLPLVLLELGLKVAALLGLARAERVRWGNKPVWAAIILLVGMFGPLAWFFLGREDGPAERA